MEDHHLHLHPHLRRCVSGLDVEPVGVVPVSVPRDVRPTHTVGGWRAVRHATRSRLSRRGGATLCPGERASGQERANPFASGQGVSETLCVRSGVSDPLRVWPWRERTFLPVLTAFRTPFRSRSQGLCGPLPPRAPCREAPRVSLPQHPQQGLPLGPRLPLLQQALSCPGARQGVPGWHRCSRAKPGLPRPRRRHRVDLPQQDVLDAARPGRSGIQGCC